MVNSEKKTIIDIDTESFRLVVRKWNSLTRGFINSFVEWMQQEIKKEEAEKPTVEEGKIEEKPPKEIRKEEAVPVKSPRGSGTRLMSEDHLLKRYDNGAVWDVVLDYICANVPDEFKRGDVAECVSKYYKTEIKRMVKPSTADNYAGIYIKYMNEEDTPYRIERCDDPNVSPVVLYRRVTPEKPEEAVEEQELSDVAVVIYDFAERSHWVDRKIPVSIALIEKSLPEYSSKEIDDAVTELIKKNKVAQFPNNKILF